MALRLRLPDQTHADVLPGAPRKAGSSAPPPLPPTSRRREDRSSNGSPESWVMLGGSPVIERWSRKAEDARVPVVPATSAHRWLSLYEKKN